VAKKYTFTTETQRTQRKHFDRINRIYPPLAGSQDRRKPRLGINLATRSREAEKPFDSTPFDLTPFESLRVYDRVFDRACRFSWSVLPLSQGYAFGLRRCLGFRATH
jgi:hypothetical protein